MQNIDNEVEKKCFSSENLKYNTQKRIGYIFAGFTLWLFIVNIFNALVIFKPEDIVADLLIYSFLLVQSIIFFWTTSKKHVTTKRFIQFLIIMMDGFLTLFTSADQFYYAICLLIFGCLIFLQYDFFLQRKFNTIIIVIILIISSIFIYNRIFGPAMVPYSSTTIADKRLANIYKISKAVNDIIFVTLFLILFPSIYIDQVKFYQSINDLVIKEKESMATFAKIGMMLNNTVHNFNNKIVTYLSCEYIISTTLKKYKDVIEPEDYEKLTMTCEMISRTSSDMISMISDMRDVIKSKSNKELQNFEVNNAIEQVIKEYELSYNSKKLDISLEKSKTPLIISDSSIKFIQVLENIIKNGIESSQNPVIKIKVIQQDNSAVIVVSDNGHGIPFCQKCNKRDCLVCTNFEIGKTTKKEGSGTGMIYVQSTLKEMNADLKIDSSPHGTDVTIILKKLATKELDNIDNLIHDESLSAGDNAVQA